MNPIHFKVVLLWLSFHMVFTADDKQFKAGAVLHLSTLPKLHLHHMPTHVTANFIALCQLQITT